VRRGFLAKRIASKKKRAAFPRKAWIPFFLIFAVSMPLWKNRGFFRFPLGDEPFLFCLPQGRISIFERYVMLLGLSFPSGPPPFQLASPPAALHRRRRINS